MDLHLNAGNKTSCALITIGGTTREKVMEICPVAPSKYAGADAAGACHGTELALGRRWCEYRTVQRARASMNLKHAARFSSGGVNHARSHAIAVKPQPAAIAAGSAHDTDAASGNRTLASSGTRDSLIAARHCRPRQSTRPGDCSRSSAPRISRARRSCLTSVSQCNVRTSVFSNCLTEKRNAYCAGTGTFYGPV